jgi:hypothetical protein
MLQRLKTPSAAKADRKHIPLDHFSSACYQKHDTRKFNPTQIECTSSGKSVAPPNILTCTTPYCTRRDVDLNARRHSDMCCAIIGIFGILNQIEIETFWDTILVCSFNILVFNPFFLHLQHYYTSINGTPKKIA